MKKHFAFSSEKQLWRILISDSDKLVLETRDTNTKEVFFHCFDLLSSKNIFSDVQLEEKQWLGIETIYNDVLFFHRFPRRDMPEHKDIIAWEIDTQKELWKNTDCSFLFAYQEKIFAFRHGFEGRHFFSFGYRDGTLLEDLGNDYTLVNSLKQEMENSKEWNSYIYPEKLSLCDNFQIKDLIESNTKKFEIADEIEYNTFKNLLFFNFHQKNSYKSFTNRFCSIDTSSGEVLLEVTLNSNAGSLFTDSFFVYKSFLFLLKEKNEVMIMRLD